MRLLCLFAFLLMFQHCRGGKVGAIIQGVKTGIKGGAKSSDDAASAGKFTVTSGMEAAETLTTARVMTLVGRFERLNAIRANPIANNLGRSETALKPVYGYPAPRPMEPPTTYAPGRGTTAPRPMEPPTTYAPSTGSIPPPSNGNVVAPSQTNAAPFSGGNYGSAPAETVASGRNVAPSPMEISGNSLNVIHPIRTSDGSARTVPLRTYEAPAAVPNQPSQVLVNGGRPPRDTQFRILFFQGSRTNGVATRKRSAYYALQWTDIRKKPQNEQALEIFLIALDIALSVVIDFLVLELINYITIKGSQCDPKTVGVGYTCEGFNEERFEPVGYECVDTCGYRCADNCFKELAWLPELLAGMFGLSAATNFADNPELVFNVICERCFHHREPCEDPLPNRVIVGSGCDQDSNGTWQCSSICPQRCASGFFPYVVDEVVICCTECKYMVPKHYTFNCSKEPSYLYNAVTNPEVQTYMLGDEEPGICVRCHETCDHIAPRGYRGVIPCGGITDIVCEPCQGTLPKNTRWAGNFYGENQCYWECLPGFTLYNGQCVVLCLGQQGFGYTEVENGVEVTKTICCDKCNANQYVHRRCGIFNGVYSPTWCCNRCPLGQNVSQHCSSPSSPSSTVCQACPYVRNAIFVPHETLDCKMTCPIDYNFQIFSLDTETSAGQIACLETCKLNQYRYFNAIGDPVCDDCVYGSRLAVVQKIGNIDNRCNAWCQEPLVLSYTLTLDWLRDPRHLKNVHCCYKPPDNYYVVEPCNDVRDNIQFPCSTCPDGYYISFPCTVTSDTECRQCPINYIPSDDRLSCVPCPYGYKTTRPGYCGFECEYPSFVMYWEGTAYCETCPPGYYYIPDSVLDYKCSGCPIGTYQNMSGQTACMNCDVCRNADFQTLISVCTSTKNTVCGTCEKECGINMELTSCYGTCVCKPGYILIPGGLRCCPPDHYSDGYLCKPCATCANPVRNCTLFANTYCGCTEGQYLEPAKSKFSLAYCKDCAYCYPAYHENIGYCDGTTSSDTNKCRCIYEQDFRTDFWCFYHSTDPGCYKRCPKCYNCSQPHMVGSYIFDDNNSQCEKGVSGFRYCICEYGYAYNKTANTCSLCEKGYEVVDTLCTMCQLGYYKPISNNSACQPCPKGYYTLNTGSTFCVQCPQGKFNVLLSQTYCQGCAVGTYNPSSTDKACLFCEDGSYPSAVTSSTCTETTSQTGICYYEFTNFSGSVQCPVGKISRANYNARENYTWVIEVPNATNISVTFKNGTGDAQVVTTFNADFLKIYPCVNRTCTPVTFTGNYLSTSFLQPYNIDNLIFNTNALVIEWTSQMPNLGWTLRWAANTNPIYQCTAGNYKVNSMICAQCPRGTFSWSVPSTGCNACPPGNYQDKFASTHCLSCPTGSYQPHEAMSSCSECPAGYFSPDALQCSECTTYGTFSTVNSTACRWCQEGTYSSTIASTGCSNCSVCHEFATGTDCLLHQDRFCKCNRNYNGNGITCRKCENFTKWVDTAVRETWCVFCEPGEYLPNCEWCSKGKFQPFIYFTFCISCAPGEFQLQVGQTLCHSCPVGRYQENNESTFCKSCASNSYTLEPNVSNCQYCNRSEYFCYPNISKPTTGLIYLDCPNGYIDKRRYTNDELVIFTINITNAKQITLEFLNFYIDSDNYLFLSIMTQTNRDFLLIYNCSVVTPACLLHNFTGAVQNLYDIHFYLTIKSSVILLVWQTDSSITADGWHVRYFSDARPCYPCPSGKYALTQGATYCDYPPTTVTTNAPTTSSSSTTTYPLTTSTTTSRAPTTSTTPAPTTTPAPLVCLRGYFQNYSVCDKCAPGTHKNYEGVGTSCALCVPGFYSNYYGAESCTACNFNLYGTGFGATVCTKCALGKFSNLYGSTTESECQFCEPSTYGVSEIFYNFCFSCSPGKYQTGFGMTSESACQSCLSGTFSSAVSSSPANCLACQAGTYSSANASTSCTYCSVGLYNDKTSQTKCQLCPSGKDSEFPFTFCSACSIYQYPCYANLSRETTSYCPNGRIIHKTSGAAESVVWYVIPFTNNSLGTVTITISNTPSTTFDTGNVAVYGRKPSRCGVGVYSCLLASYNFYGTSQHIIVLEDTGDFNITFFFGQYRNFDVQFTLDWNTGLKSCAPCPTGLMSLKEDGPFCDTCAYGYYSSQSKCLPCPAGTYCPFNSTPVTCNNFRWGNVLAQSTFESGCNNLCVACPSGTVRVNCSGSSAGVCIACPANFYGGGFVCSQCPLGSTSQSSSPDIEDCQCAGQNQIYQGSCSPCLANMSKLGQKCVCDENFYGAFPAQCQRCPANSYSPKNTTQRLGCICNDNFQSPLCDRCFLGYYLLNSQCLPCEAGTFCPDGLSRVDCPVNFWGTSQAQSTSASACPNPCGTCALGQYKSSCQGSSEGTCLPCPSDTYGGGAGFTTPCTACPVLSTSPQGSTTFDACECQGDYQMHQSVCQPCMQNMVKLGRYCVCAQDYYGYFPLGCSACQPNSDSPVNSTKGSDCVCRPNFQPPYCSICVLGYYLADSQCNICQEDHYCADGISMTPCQENSDSPQGSYASGACICRPNFQPPYCSICVLGYYQSGQACVECPQGYYCLNGRNATQCPENTWGNLTGKGTPSSACPYSCEPCLPGYERQGCYADQPGACSVCPANFYGDGFGPCLPCKPGSVSPQGSQSSQDCLCPANYDDVGSQCVPCPDNSITLNDRCVCRQNYYGTSLTGCSPCPGRVNSPANTTTLDQCVCSNGWRAPNCAICALGYYFSFWDQDCFLCYSGHFCLDGTNAEMCPEGTYQPLEGQSSCLNCTLCSPGYVRQNCFLDQEGTCQPCPSNTYGRGIGTLEDNCVSCPEGLVSQPGSGYEEDCICPGNAQLIEGVCVACPANTVKLKRKCVCQANYYGTFEQGCTPCSSRATSPINSTTVDGCVCGNFWKSPLCDVCIPGYYFYSYWPECFECWKGYYCSDGIEERPCPADTYTTGFGQSACNPCAQCPPGSGRIFCGGSDSGSCQLCPGNTYGGTGNYYATCKPCPGGTNSPAGSPTIYDCECPDNYQITEAGCMPCLENMVKVGRKCVCVEDFYGSFETNCNRCPLNSTSVLGSVNITNCKCAGNLTLVNGSCVVVLVTTSTTTRLTTTSTSLAPTTSTSTSLAPTTSTSTSLAPTTSTTTSLAPTTSTSTSLAPTTSTTTSFATTTLVTTSLTTSTISLTTSTTSLTTSTTSLTTSTTSLTTSTTSLSTTTTLTTTTTPIITTTTRAPLCTPGSYENGIECVICPEGYFCPDGRDIFECGGGMWGNTTNQSSYYDACANPCGGCPQSEWRSFCKGNFEGICAPCPANTYGGGPASFTPCTPCPVDSTSPPGSSSIEQCQCPANMWLVSGNCSLCPANMTFVNGGCVCSPNYHGSFFIGCLPCPANSDSPINSLTILQCVCRANFYRDSNLCLACPSNSTSPPASLSISACKCVANFYSSSYQCLKCPEFSTSPASSSFIYDCTCIPGYIRDEPYLCRPCLAGYVCPSQYVTNNCPENTWGNLTGQHEISKACPFPCGTCPPGQYKVRCGAFNPGVCRECEAGQYGGGQGAVSVAWCQTCPTGSTSQRGSGYATDCACKQNFYGSPGLFCWPCPSNSQGVFGATDVLGCVCNANFYGPDQFAQCAACPQHSSSPKGSRVPQNCTCLPGFYGPNGGACEPCQLLWSCPGGNASFPPYFSRTLIGISACCDVIATFPGSPAVNFYPVTFQLASVVLAYDDGFAYSLPISSPNLTFRFDAAYLSLNSTTFSVLNIRTYPSSLLLTNVTVVVNSIFTSTLTVTIPDVTELMLQTYFPEGLDPSKRELRRFQCSDQYQWIEVTCKARLNLPAIIPISSKCSFFVRDTRVAKVSGNTIVGVSPGTTSGFAVWWGRQAEIPAFEVLDESVEFSELTGTDYLFYGVSGERQPIFLGIIQTFANGVNTQAIPNVFNSEFAKLIQVSLPLSGSVIRQGNVLVSQLNSLYFETIFFTLPPCNGRQLTYNSTLLVNLAPAPGDLDAGHVQGVAITPDMLAVSLRFNLDGVLGFHSEFGCDFQITDCVPSPLFSGESACTVFDPTGAVRVAGINRGQSGIVEVAILFVEGTPGGLQGWIQTTKGFTSIIAGKWGPGSMNPDPFFPAFPLLDINSVYRANGENLLVLVNQQRLLVNSIVFASDRELSVLIRLVNRMDIPSTDRIRAYYHVNSTVDLPYPAWHQVQHLRDGWYGIEFKGVISQGWAKISILIETLDDRGVTGQSRRRVYGTIPITPYNTLNLSGLDFAHLRLGESFSSCPREAETPGQLSVTYKIEVSGEPKVSLLELSNSLGCLIGVARRRVDITFSPSLLYVQVTLESFLRLYEVNLFVLDEAKMGEWLSKAGMTFVELRRKWQEFSRDSPDLPSECPHGKYYYKGQYVTLPPHAIPVNCYAFTCERGYHLVDQWCARVDAEEQVYWNVVALLCLLIFFSGLLALIIKQVITNLLAKAPPTQPKEDDPFLLPVDVTEHGDLVFAAEIVEQRSCHSCHGKFEGCPCSVERPDQSCCCRMERGEDCHCCCCFLFSRDTSSAEGSEAGEAGGS